MKKLLKFLLKGTRILNFFFIKMPRLFVALRATQALQAEHLADLLIETFLKRFKSNRLAVLKQLSRLIFDVVLPKIL